VTDGDRFFTYLTPYFAGLVILGLLLSARASTEVKRTWLPRIIIANGLVLIALVYWLVPVPPGIFFPLPAIGIALATIVNLRIKRFCPKCGAHGPGFGALYRQGYCYRCGYSFTEPDGTLKK
jgi:hypothetical protein